MGHTAIWDSGLYKIYSNLGYMGYTAIWDLGPCGTHSNLGLRAMWDTQRFGPQGHMGYTAIWAIGPYETHGDLGLRAIWDKDTGPFSRCSTRYLGHLRGLYVVEPLLPNFSGGFSKIRGH